ncbi:MAG: UbiA family prenyltransferase, partial [Candidatus Cyclobacteriaceae bacterium M3_2C_046]
MENTTNINQPYWTSIRSFLFSVIKLIRPHHWVKNAFLFIPLFFAGEFFNIEKIYSLTVGFIAFSLIASSIYVINDYNDIIADRLHPEKRKRPLASGDLAKPVGIAIFVLLFLSGFTLGY